MPFLAISAAFAYFLNYLANDMEKIQKCTLAIIYDKYFIFLFSYPWNSMVKNKKKKHLGLTQSWLLFGSWLVVSSRSSLAHEMTKLCMLLLYLVLF